MNRIEATVSLLENIEKGEWPEAMAMLTDDFKFFGPEPEPVDKQTWLAFQQALMRAVPDWSFKLSEIEESGDQIFVKVAISGTHTGPLDLPIGSLPKLPPTQMKVSLPPETVEIKYRDDKVVEVHSAGILKGGILGMLSKLGKFGLG